MMEISSFVLMLLKAGLIITLLVIGFFVFNRKIFDYLEDKDECDLERGALEKVAESGELMMYRHPDFWYCMDTPRDFDYLRNMWRNGNVPWKRWKD